MSLINLTLQTLILNRLETLVYMKLRRRPCARREDIAWLVWSGKPLDECAGATLPAKTMNGRSKNVIKLSSRGGHAENEFVLSITANLVGVSARLTSCLEATSQAWIWAEKAWTRNNYNSQLENIFELRYASASFSSKSFWVHDLPFNKHCKFLFLKIVT